MSADELIHYKSLMYYYKLRTNNNFVIPLKIKQYGGLIPTNPQTAKKSRLIFFLRWAKKLNSADRATKLTELWIKYEHKTEAEMIAGEGDYFIRTPCLPTDYPHEIQKIFCSLSYLCYEKSDMKIVIGATNSIAAGGEDGGIDHSRYVDGWDDKDPNLRADITITNTEPYDFTQYKPLTIQININDPIRFTPLITPLWQKVSRIIFDYSTVKFWTDTNFYGDDKCFWSNILIPGGDFLIPFKSGESIIRITHNPAIGTYFSPTPHPFNKYITIMLSPHIPADGKQSYDFKIVKHIWGTNPDDPDGDPIKIPNPNLPNSLMVRIPNIIFYNGKEIQSIKDDPITYRNYLKLINEHNTAYVQKSNFEYHIYGNEPDKGFEPTPDKYKPYPIPEYPVDHPFRKEISGEDQPGGLSMLGKFIVLTKLDT
jgi:hypothetical protein